MTLAEAEALFACMLDGGMDDAEIAATLVDLADKGETAEDLARAYGLHIQHVRKIIRQTARKSE